jgi:hypothetical protein
MTVLYVRYCSVGSIIAYWLKPSLCCAGIEESGHKFQPQIQDANERRRERQEPGMQRCQSRKRWKKIRNVVKPIKERRVR